VRGHWVEAGEWTEALLALPGAATPSVERAQGLWLRGILAWMRRDVARARPALEESLALARAEGDQAATANALYGLGVVAAARQEPQAAVALTAEAVAIWRDLGDEAQLSRALTSQGILLRDRGDLAEARRLLQEGLALCRARGYAVGAGWALDELGTIAFAGGDLETAAACFKEGAAYRYEVLDGALAVSLRHLAEVAAATSRWKDAARLLGAAESVSEHLGADDRLQPDWHNVAPADPLPATARRLLGEERFAAEWAAGRALTLQGAMALALAAGPAA
jgi:non-specific serine/threonine protein kinase